MSSKYPSWGNYPDADQTAYKPTWRGASLFPDKSNSLLPRGNGRSYGDSCLNDKGTLLDATALDHYIHFDPDSGTLSCEAGVLLADILEVIEPHGWFLPSTPGTKFVTVGGAIANDVHGKNHHARGCFSHHVVDFLLHRSDGTDMLCSEDENPDWFRATVGGLGLTGFISRATLRLMKVESPYVQTETIKMQNLDDFFRLSEESSDDFEYTVSWIDCLARGKKRGRGHFIRGNHTTAPASYTKPGNGKLSVPFTLPISAINPLSLRIFNSLYYNKQRKLLTQSVQARDPFFYPLDGILHWNRLYGRRGFLQYQCVIPNENAKAVIAELLDQIAHSRSGSFLIVLKAFGDIQSRGMLSFARPGVTLAMDFPFHGKRTLTLLDRLDQLTAQAGGAIYPAKDARMSSEHFKQFYPEWDSFLKFKDPMMSSGLWRRVTGDS